MHVMSHRPAIGLLFATLALSASGSAFAQQQTPDNNIVVTGAPAPAPAPLAAAMTPGPQIKGIISARSGDRIKVTTDTGSVILAINDATQIRASGGLFSSRSKLATDSLLNGLPITAKTLQSGEGGELVASQISFKKTDLKVAGMIRNGTAQGFEEQTAATEALRGRMGDIDKYNVKATTNVHFDTGRADLSPAAKADLCTTAHSAEQMENALILVIGYTDSTGSEDINQELSDKRAGKVMNFLQQKCGWKPYRMLTPTGMATSDPLASNDTEEGKAQNRRVAVNVLVSKSVDGL